MQNFLFTLIGSFLVLGCNDQSFVKLSKALGEKQGDAVGKLKKQTFHDVRKKLWKQEEVAFLKSSFDSLFLLEEHSVESMAYYGRIWTKNDSIYYVYSDQDETFNFFKDDINFTDYTSYLVRKWDTAGIREQEKLYTDILTDQIIYGSLVVRKNKTYNIQTIRFKRFYNIERDRFDFL